MKTYKLDMLYRLLREASLSRKTYKEKLYFAWESGIFKFVDEDFNSEDFKVYNEIAEWIKRNSFEAIKERLKETGEDFYEYDAKKQIEKLWDLFYNAIVES